MSKPLLLLVPLLTSCLFVGCSDNTPVCAPKSTLECICPTGKVSQQVCAADAQDYGTCDCGSAGAAGGGAR